MVLESKTEILTRLPSSSPELQLCLDRRLLSPYLTHLVLIIVYHPPLRGRGGYELSIEVSF